MPLPAGRPLPGLQARLRRRQAALRTLGRMQPCLASPLPLWRGEDVKKRRSWCSGLPAATICLSAETLRAPHLRPHSSSASTSQPVTGADKAVTGRSRHRVHLPPQRLQGGGKQQETLRGSCRGGGGTMLLGKTLLGFASVTKSKIVLLSTPPLSGC